MEKLAANLRMNWAPPSSSSQEVIEEEVLGKSQEGGESEEGEEEVWKRVRREELRSGDPL